jgi:hypothetical protein
MRRRGQLVVILTHLALAFPQAAGAQLALAAGAHDDDFLPIVNRAVLAAALKPNLTIRLVSDWPQLAAADGSCLNGGWETVAGSLELDSGGDYVGTLTRQAEIRFCGAHGAARDACILRLTSLGPVHARGAVQPLTTGWTNPVLELRWTGSPEGGEIRIEGDCAPAFNEALRRMYLGVTHALEFRIPVAGGEGLADHLDDYGWRAEVR